MGARGELFGYRDPYDLAGSEALFLRAMRENCRFEQRGCPAYDAILKGFGFSPDALTDAGALARLPFLPTLFFKRNAVAAMPKRRIAVTATSSGTKGSVSRIGFAWGDLFAALRMVIRLCRRHRLFSLVPTHYIVLGYKPDRANRTAVSKTAFGATLFAPAASRTFALKRENGVYRPDLEGVAAAVMKHAAGRLPVRFMGFPSYTYFLLSMLDERGMRLKLPRGSKILMAGGWKQFYTEQVDKAVLYALAERVLGIGEGDITEFYGAVEHPVMYTSCGKHHFHIPVYSRVIVRDPDTLAPLPPGQVGLVELLTPTIRATPVLAVMTDDLGVLHPSGSCGCGIDAPWLEIIGRVGLRDIRTCAAGAAEALAGTAGEGKA